MEHRIKSGAACDYIDLNDVEANLYRGAGWAIAHITEGEIVKFEYLNFEIGNEEAEAQEAIDAGLKHGECWFGMCGSYQFCEPRKMTLDDPTVFAKIMRLSVYDEYEE